MFRFLSWILLCEVAAGWYSEIIRLCCFLEVFIFLYIWLCLTHHTFQKRSHLTFADFFHFLFPFLIRFIWLKLCLQGLFLFHLFIIPDDPLFILFNNWIKLLLRDRVQYLVNGCTLGDGHQLLLGEIPLGGMAWLAKAPNWGCIIIIDGPKNTFV